MPIRNSCGILIKQIHDTLEKQSNNALRDQDLTLSQMAALIALNDKPDRQASLKELERELHVAQSTAAGIIARLEQKGFVESFGDATDKRIKMVRITSHGEKCCQDADQSMAKAEANLLSGLTETEREIFASLLRKVSDTVK